MTNGQGTELLAMCARFFEQELAFNQTLYCIATWAFGLAIGLAVLQALITLYKSATASGGAGGAAASIRGKGVSPVSAEMVKAITDFIAGLAKAPAWFFLFVAGLLLVWVSAVDVPEICETPFAETAAQGGGNGDAADDAAAVEDEAAVEAAATN